MEVVDMAGGSVVKGGSLSQITVVSGEDLEKEGKGQAA